jgi:hypothetical protein
MKRGSKEVNGFVSQINEKFLIISVLRPKPTVIIMWMCGTDAAKGRATCLASQNRLFRQEERRWAVS